MNRIRVVRESSRHWLESTWLASLELRRCSRWTSSTTRSSPPVEWGNTRKAILSEVIRNEFRLSPCKFISLWSSVCCSLSSSHFLLCIIWWYNATVPNAFRSIFRSFSEHFNPTGGASRLACAMLFLNTYCSSHQFAGDLHPFPWNIAFCLVFFMWYVILLWYFAINSTKVLSNGAMRSSSSRYHHPCAKSLEQP